MLALLLLGACSDNNLIDHSKDPVDVEDTASVPDISVTPVSVDYGVVLPGTPTAATVTISNVGAADLFLDGVALVAPESDVSITAIASPVVVPGASVETVVTWTPTGSPLSAILRVSSNDPDQPAVDVPLVGELPPGQIVVDPAYYDFGTLDVGHTATVPVTVSNIGAGDLTITNWSFLATDADMFIRDPGELGTLPHTLASGGSATVIVQYTPSAGGGDEGSLSIDSDDPVTPNTGAQQVGNANDPDPCEGLTQHVKIMLTADDAWQGWIDGTSFSAPGMNTWSTADTLEWDLPCGDHALSLYATDTAAVVSGVIAVVWVDDVVKYVSGPTDWTMHDTFPSGDWTAADYDDTSWHIPEVCANNSIWGTMPAPFYALGADWIWWTSNCSDLGEAWLRLNFSVP